ncbi:MAG: 50S ribosomal protein L11 methyltransferase [Desulfobulbaceae bacterium]|jgi:ribosomal protein L11 methyltransferase|nr:50S ribosomal protein L11 methyltransferase [Desulfobulbaceae bacterium]
MPPTSPTLRPDSILHIYYLEGRFPAGFRIEAEGFIGNWQEADCSFLFFAHPADESVARLLASTSGPSNLTLIDRYEMSYQDWQGGSITPFRLGKFLFNPPWLKAAAEPDDIAITLDAGVVFGNGMHATTQDCLTAISIAMAGGKVASMIDLGCGTGILSLAAAKLGCGKTLAVDLNELAARTTAVNARLNHLEHLILPVVGRAESMMGAACDLLVANIHFQVMEQIIAQDDFLRQKWFVLSGLLPSEAETIVARLRRMPVEILKRWCSSQVWHTILGITHERP